jgi:pimeloyl-ACP methyl ester carboxylesterase
MWYHYNPASDTVFVFVHGINSDSVRAWFEDKAQNSSYWPELVRTDKRFESPSIFLGGYPSELSSGPYDIRAAASDLLDELNTSSDPGKLSVLSKKNIVFVAHSMGGIVIRHLLSRVWTTSLFQDKVIGLVLVASPSLGSMIADISTYISDIGNPLLSLFGRSVPAAVDQLRWHNSFLVELHKDFLTLKTRNTLPYLTGVELVEAQFVVTGSPKLHVVTYDSAVRYFGGEPVANTDHWSIAKPQKDQTPSAHTRLLAFFQQDFASLIRAARKQPSSRKAVIMDSFAEIYDRRNALPGEMNSHVIQKLLTGLDLDVNDIEPVHDNWNNSQRIIDANPELIIIHYSSLDTRSKGTTELRNFLNKILKKTSKTQIILYGRKKPKNFTEQVRTLVDLNSKSRVHGFRVLKHGSRNETFKNQKVADELRACVKAVLDSQGGEKNYC